MIHVACNLCGSDDYRVRFPATTELGEQLDASACCCTNEGYGSHARIVTCRKCGLTYASPRWSAEQLLAAYGHVEDPTYEAERRGRELTFDRQLHKLERHTGVSGGRSLLDVGAHTGVLVEVAKRRGWEATGVEPSRWAAGVAGDRGLDIVVGTLDAPDLLGREFDVITMFDVIEHVDDPTAELAKAFKAVRPGGYMVVNTMDIDSRFARMMGRRWPWLMDMHIHYFSRDTLTRLLESVGFAAVETETESRVVTLGYASSRLGGMSKRLGQASGWVFEKLRLAERAVPIKLGDLFTAYARKPA